ncbi:MAG: efflux RND transporter periplasmic adaptor subunit [Hydrogenophaga sp.]|uniref:efflux RND transporter periplasmic adaptor subunit n=1 Tax=Hydrogenophaga sp. TaxID=1904254 RepID=UPI00169FAA17|nr:efflux RND transporter periplasmic adaptor subunit [Hydrogenophaga sp.]NIM43467.1 efflux RND transporter periplasmic adaptor subunit [Hydrogenophaga sp.]NIN28536.1 efflux RND transporter periplasmic adaptor subunit [Hydrogenophaga sp.]NIN32995.1 efflux RND transporter periplasmic adaptor subunit [Hydrogenophaga sp.]NIN57670.1 efflux RND transporter periplasmic adaptor subunit [Hydrogenophaga sp.]NIO53965.1 efflux RND transporter periplasmic adaptor subunit [Hydrogenophaga sp.]
MNQKQKTSSLRRHPWRTALIALAGLALLGGGGAAWWFQWGPGARKESTYITATIQRGDIEDQVAATGSLQPRDYVDVGAQVSGQLRKLHVEVGTEVKEGDLLAEIDAETSQARVDASRAQLRSQQAQMAERELNLVKAERDLQRQKNLMAEEATTAEALQNAETAARTARAQINSLKAQMEQVQASMRVEEANLKYTKIFAPMAGTVVSITARQGQTLNTNQQAPTLLRIADLSVMTVQTQVSEADVSKLRQGMPVYFTTLGGQGRRYYGELKKVEPTPTVTNNVVLYNALFEVPNPNRSLMTQMTAQVFFVVAEARDVLVVPMSALTLQRGGPAGRERAGQGGGANAPVVANAVPPSAAASQADKGASPPAAAAEPRRMDRAAFEGLSPEERQRLREQRRAQREAAGQGRDGAATPSAAAQPGPAPRGARGPRQAKVKVMKDDGTIEEREVTIGISNRVHAEVLSGLKEGERVVAGTRETEPRNNSSNQQGSPLGQQGMRGPGGPGGLPMAAPAGARR